LLDIKVTTFFLNGNSLVSVLSLDLVPGENLETFLSERGDNLSLQERYKIVSDICQTVSSLNERGIIHRDIKPANIIYDPQLQKSTLIDFGLSFFDRRVVVQEDYDPLLFTEPFREQGRISGSLGYMAPEVDSRSPHSFSTAYDTFSCGLFAGTLLTGKSPAIISDDFRTNLYFACNYNGLDHRLILNNLTAQGLDPAFISAIAETLYFNPDKRRLGPLKEESKRLSQQTHSEYQPPFAIPGQFNSNPNQPTVVNRNNPQPLYLANETVAETLVFDSID